MSLDPHVLAGRISAEAGLEFAGGEGRDGEGRRWLELHPSGHHRGQTFSIRTTVGWRRLDVRFLPGNFAGDLLAAMGAADETGQASFRAILDLCRADGADLDFAVNGAAASPNDDAIWSNPWRSMSLSVRRGMLAINEGDETADSKLVELWAGRVAVAILALLPVEVEDEDSRNDEGLPEGARTRIEVNRYERDRRNRAAALSIHGYGCKACGLLLDDRYGPAATGLIEVHHVTPVSELGAGYIINPRDDLVPLCPNCHTVAHRRSPPYTVEELREMMIAG
ncbi:HNH endonuclease [Sphingomonas sp. PB2P19]|uniref:HNH endonuclease n=1 Tax=Sphingomonas rhamnosi TaxID=3096156 RepID=UPI002FC60156